MARDNEPWPTLRGLFHTLNPDVVIAADSRGAQFVPRPGVHQAPQRTIDLSDPKRKQINVDAPSEDSWGDDPTIKPNDADIEYL